MFKANVDQFTKAHGRPLPKKNANKKADDNDPVSMPPLKKPRTSIRTTELELNVILVHDTPSVDAGTMAYPTTAVYVDLLVVYCLTDLFSRIRKCWAANLLVTLAFLSSDSPEVIFEKIYTAFTGEHGRFKSTPELIEGLRLMCKEGGGRGSGRTALLKLVARPGMPSYSDLHG